jgi:hypothetical protein
VACATCGAVIHRPDGSKIEVTGAAASEVQQVALALAKNAEEHAAARRAGPWVSGSFYLVALLLILGILAVIADQLPVWVLPCVILGGLLAVSVIGALQLRQDQRISEKTFLALMRLTMKQLPLIRSTTDPSSGK